MSCTKIGCLRKLALLVRSNNILLQSGGLSSCLWTGSVMSCRVHAIVLELLSTVATAPDCHTPSQGKQG